MKFSRIFLKVVFIILLFLSSANLVFAKETIKSFDVLLTVHKNGEMTVEEKITYDFDDGLRHGIYRNIPLVSKVGDLYRVISVDFIDIKKGGLDEKYEID